MWRIVIASSLALASLAAAANSTHQQLQQLGDGPRAALFAKLLRSTGEPCPSVSRTFYQGSDRSGAAFWNVQCAGGKAWSVMIRNDAIGSTRYLDCDAMLRMEGAPCFRRF